MFVAQSYLTRAADITANVSPAEIYASDTKFVQELFENST